MHDFYDRNPGVVEEIPNRQRLVLGKLSHPRAAETEKLGSESRRDETADPFGCVLVILPILEG